MLGQLEAALVCQRQVERIRGVEMHGSEERAREDEVRRLASRAADLPALPSGGSLAISTVDLAECDTGGQLWSSAHVLCRFARDAAESFQGSSVLELGCGTGCVGLFRASSIRLPIMFRRTCG